MSQQSTFQDEESFPKPSFSLHKRMTKPHFPSSCFTSSTYCRSCMVHILYISHMYMALYVAYVHFSFTPPCFFSSQGTCSIWFTFVGISGVYQELLSLVSKVLTCEFQFPSAASWGREPECHQGASDPQRHSQFQLSHESQSETQLLASAHNPWCPFQAFTTKFMGFISQLKAFQMQT